jgi:hypothetical protein
MALIANNINTKQSPPPREAPIVEPISFTEIVQKRLDAEVASKRPLIYNPIEAAALVTVQRQDPEPEHETEPVQQSNQNDVIVPRRVTKRSQYMRDMLTVEKL